MSACFRCFPAPTHLIHMNRSLSGYSRARWRADHLSQVCWSSEASTVKQQDQKTWCIFMCILISKSYRWFNTTIDAQSLMVTYFSPSNHPSFGFSASDRCFLPNAASTILSAGQEGTVWRRWKPRPKRTEGATYSYSVALCKPYYQFKMLLVQASSLSWSN